MTIALSLGQTVGYCSDKIDGVGAWMPRTQSRFIEWLDQRFYVYKDPITRIIVYMPPEEKTISIVHWQTEALLEYCHNKNIQILEYDRKTVLKHICGKCDTLQNLLPIVRQRTKRQFIQKSSVVAVCAFHYIKDIEDFKNMELVTQTRLQLMIMSKYKKSTPTLTMELF